MKKLFFLVSVLISGVSIAQNPYATIYLNSGEEQIAYDGSNTEEPEREMIRVRTLRSANIVQRYMRRSSVTPGRCTSQMRYSHVVIRSRPTRNE